MLPFVLVLIAKPGGTEAALLEAAAGALPDLDTGSDWPAARWLGHGEALEVHFHSPAHEAAMHLRGRIAAALSEKPLDICVVPAAHRRKKLLVADMDSTIIGQECIDEMADMLGLKPQIAAITERAMRGELQFEAALTERLRLLAGITEAQLDQVWRERVTLNRGARTLLATMTQAGAATALVSGGFTFFTGKVAAAAGFAVNYANTLEVVDGRLTGRVVGPILGREAKLTTLERLRDENRLAADETLAIGDGANDLAMIKAAGLGVAYRAKPIVAAEAHAALDHGDLTGLLYLQGYRRDEFVERG